MSNHRYTYAELKKRLERLAVSLLPDDRPSGDYSEGEVDRIHAYVVLAHAELEDFIERLASSVVDQAERKSNATSCHPLMSRLILYRTARVNEKFEPLTSDLISAARSFYDKTVHQNHGIKSRNLLGLLLPLGINHSQIDAVLMANLDAFGATRGEIAHTAARLRQGSSPGKERTAVNNILAGLSHLDQTVRRIT